MMWPEDVIDISSLSHKKQCEIFDLLLGRLTSRKWKWVYNKETDKIEGLSRGLDIKIMFELYTWMNGSAGLELETNEQKYGVFDVHCMPFADNEPFGKVFDKLEKIYSRVKRSFLRKEEEGEEKKKQEDKERKKQEVVDKERRRQKYLEDGATKLLSSLGN